MRIFSYLFHAVLALFMVGISIVAWSSGQNLNLDMLPWSSAAATPWLLGLGLLAIVSIVLALKGTLRILFVLWSAAVVVLLIRGFFFSPYVFDGAADFRNALLFVFAALLAFVGAWLSFRREPKTR
jgi:hypothetical protein